MEELLGEFDQVKGIRKRLLNARASYAKVEGRIGNDSISNNTTTTTTNKESRKPMDPVDRYLVCLFLLPVLMIPAGSAQS